ncbi:hypothetical protein Dimus_006797 [Dionaea muscipula]
MAVRLSNPSLALPRPSPSSSSASAKPLKTLNVPISCRKPQLQFQFQFLSRSIPRFGLSSPPPPILRHVFKSRFSPEDSISPESEGQEQDEDDLVDAKEEESDADLKSSLPDMETLVKTYKEAILAADEKSSSEIERLLVRIENEKKEAALKVSALSTELASGREKYIRLQADFDNFRKRSENERLNIRNDAQGEVIQSLLPMVDSFERAKQQIRPETEKETKIDTSYQGIYKQLVEIMRSLRVAAVATIGKPFDPSVHEAIAREESEEFKAGIVIQELRRGFLLGNRLLRPAMVKVSSGPGKKKAASAAAFPKTTERLV